MDQNPDVTVEEITEEITNENANRLAELAKILAPRGVKLGSEVLELKFNRLLAITRNRSDRLFLLSWIGNKVPRGAQILDQQVTWTQHGMVQAEPGGNIGTYDRLVEFGGRSGKEHLMLVYLLG